MSEPNWDMTPYFDVFDGEDYRSFRTVLESDTASLQQEMGALGSVGDHNLGDWAALLGRIEELTARSTHLGSYLGCLSAADSVDETIQRESASAAAARAEVAKIFVALRAALGATDDAHFERLVEQPSLAEVRHYLTRMRTSARWRMDAELEALATDLAVDGLSAWGRLYDQISGKLEFDLQVPGRETRRVPVAGARSLLEDPDPQVRRAALVGSNAAWESAGDAVAACLNGIAGTRHTLYHRRGVPHFLEPALFDASVSRATLDALLAAVRERQPVAQSFLRRKARLLGRERLGFQDLTAPLPLANSETIPWDHARKRVLDAFGRFYPDLEKFASDAFEQRWIDHEPRAGKRPGGFCSSTPLIQQSRIFLTFNDTLGDVAVVAHELGHAFHSWLMRDMRWWSRSYPMTLAETASTFAEQLVIDAVLEDPEATREQRAIILDSRMQDGAAFLLNIPMRFDFERAFYEERRDGEVSVSRLKELMVDAQRRSYGDCLDEDEFDPWFWASKLHFYITGISFYNFPYTFGYLFSLGIFARAKREGPGFLKQYENLLRLTGSDSAENVARRCLGVDLEQPDFWHESIDLIEAGLADFESAIDGLFDPPGP
jgi:oligoendopeptidase F